MPLRPAHCRALTQALEERLRELLLFDLSCDHVSRFGQKQHARAHDRTLAKRLLNGTLLGAFFNRDGLHIVGAFYWLAMEG